MKASAPFPTVSVVIPCRDAAATLGHQLAALGRQTYPEPVEIIVADNGSRDDSRDVARRAGVRVVDASGRRGPNRARNAGASRAGGELVLVCDADDVVADDWVAEMVSALQDFDLVGGSLEREKLNAGAGPGWVPAFADDLPRFGFLPAASGANFGIRRDVLRSLGGWDESFEGGPDDIELCWRAQLQGYSLGHTPDAVVHYRMRPTTLGMARQVYRRATYLPLLFRRFRPEQIPRRLRLAKAARYGTFVVLAWPLAVVRRRWRREWVRRVAMIAGVARGLLREVDPPSYGLEPAGSDRA